MAKRVEANSERAAQIQTQIDLYGLDGWACGENPGAGIKQFGAYLKARKALIEALGEMGVEVS